MRWGNGTYPWPLPEGRGKVKGEGQRWEDGEGDHISIGVRR